MSIENKDAVPSGLDSVQAVKIFCCYEPRNMAFWKELENFLAVLKRSGQIVGQYVKLCVKVQGPVEPELARAWSAC